MVLLIVTYESGLMLKGLVLDGYQLLVWAIMIISTSKILKHMLGIGHR